MLDQSAIDSLRAATIPDQAHLIGGHREASQSGETLDVISPIDGTRICGLAAGSAADMNRAISSARAAFEDGRWSRTAPAHRKKVLHKLADLIERDALALTVLGVRDNGTEINMAYKAEALSAAATFRYYAELVDKVYGEIAPTADNVLGLVHRAPVGVVGAIVPWNFPLMIGAWKIAPALAAGNAVVLKAGGDRVPVLAQDRGTGARSGRAGGCLQCGDGHWCRGRRGARAVDGGRRSGVYRVPAQRAAVS